MDSGNEQKRTGIPPFAIDVGTAIAARMEHFFAEVDSLSEWVDANQGEKSGLLWQPGTSVLLDPITGMILDCLRRKERFERLMRMNVHRLELLKRQNGGENVQ